MAINAIFFGINKHLDAAIPEFSRATRDAMTTLLHPVVEVAPDAREDEQ